MSTLPFAVGEPFPSSVALRLGYSSRLLAKGVDAGYLIKLRHGWYCRTPAADESRAVAIRRSISVALADGAEDTVASHTSAALLHGLPLVGNAESPTIHLTGSRPNGGRTAQGLMHHTSPAPPTAVDVEGLRATSVPRTVADLSRTCGFVPGVCAADAALRTGLMTSRDFTSRTG